MDEDDTEEVFGVDDEVKMMLLELGDFAFDDLMEIFCNSGTRLVWFDDVMIEVEVEALLGVFLEHVEPFKVIFIGGELFRMVTTGDEEVTVQVELEEEKEDEVETPTELNEHLGAIDVVVN